MIIMHEKSFKSYAKINISLSIEGKREDGYHELDSIMVPIELHDSLIMSPLYQSHDNFITVDDFSNGLIHFNLVGNCINAMADKYKFKNKYRVYIHKNIPMQAGLGGGSSNAAYAMKAVNQMLKLNATEEELIEIATPLGADIPFFIKGVPARCKGIGEKIEPIKLANTYYVLLVKPNEGISTKEAFKLCDSKPYKKIDIDSVKDALEEGNDDMLASSMGNSLLDSALGLVPEINEIITYLKKKGLKMVGMSGSGSTVFALSRDKSIFRDIIPQIEDKWFVELTKTLK